MHAACRPSTLVTGPMGDVDLILLLGFMFLCVVVYLRLGQNFHVPFTFRGRYHEKTSDPVVPMHSALYLWIWFLKDGVCLSSSGWTWPLGFSPKVVLALRRWPGRHLCPGGCSLCSWQAGACGVHANKNMQSHSEPYSRWIHACASKGSHILCVACIAIYI